jgi:hypothetical protein
MSNVKIKEVTYKLHEKCLQISNEEVDLIVTTQEGPRIIRYGFSGQRNQFCDDAPLTLDVKGEKWRLMGGHRLWHSPEKFPRTYMPDNKPVNYKKTDNGVIVYQKADPWVQIDKEMEISLYDEGPEVLVKHTIINKNAWLKN